MANPNPPLENLKPFKPGQSGNPKGVPKGTKHISTWIQEMLNDEEFETTLLDAKKQEITFKGAPLKAIILTAQRKAVGGDHQWAEWLAKHGYGNKLIIETGDPVEAALKKLGLLEDEGAGEVKNTSGETS